MTGFSLFILAGLQIWDIWLTTRILRAGGRELNGIVASIMEAVGGGWGPVKYGLGMGASVLMAAAGHGWIIWPIIAVMAGVVDHNLTEWWKIRRRK